MLYGTPSHPHTLTSSHPHTLTPSLPHSGFNQGALDTYNCDQVFVRGSCFRDNGPVFVTKPQGFRAQSAGLSISESHDPEVS